MGEPTDAEIDAALERGRIAKQGEPRARACHYDIATKRVVVELANGCVFGFPARLGQGLERASDEQLAQVEILGGGSGLHLYGFAKNEQENIGPDEVASLREIAMAWLEADADRIADAVEAGELQEVEHGEDGT